MHVKTNIILSVLVGGYPVIHRNEDMEAWLQDYSNFLALLPHITVKGLNGKDKLMLNYEACRAAILNECPEFNKVDNFVSQHARKQISTSTIVDDNGKYTEDYLRFCDYLIDYAEEETGKSSHEFTISEREF